LVPDYRAPVVYDEKRAEEHHEVITNKNNINTDQIRNRVKNTKIAFITGASRGIGEEFARVLAKQGYCLGLLASNKERLMEVAEECKKLGSKKTKIYAVDLSKLNTDIEDAVTDCVNSFGGLDVLLNNAGISRRASVLRANPQIWDKVIAVNLQAVMRLCIKSLQVMKIQKSGHIIFTNSVVSYPPASGPAGVAPYSASKYGLTGLANSIFEDVRHLGIKVSSIMPALINNDLGTRKGPFSAVSPSLLIQNSDVANALLYLLQSGESACPTHIHLNNQNQWFPALKKMSQALNSHL